MLHFAIVCRGLFTCEFMSLVDDMLPSTKKCVACIIYIITSVFAHTCIPLPSSHYRYELIPAQKIDETKNSSTQSTAYKHPISNQFTLRRMACFGSPKFDRREPLHILSADSRFPDIEPRKIRKVGNHFLALFPVEDERKNMWTKNREVRLRRHALIRGGTNDGVKTRQDDVKEDDSNKNDYRDKSPTKLVDRWDGGRGSWSI